MPKVNAEKYSDSMRGLIVELLPRFRSTIKLPHDAIMGNRFNDDDRILWELESAYTAAEFAVCPNLAIESALTGAARADWWYDYERPYEDERDSWEHEDDDGED